MCAAVNVLHGEVRLRCNVKRTFYRIDEAKPRNCPLCFGNSILYRISVKRFVDSSQYQYI